MGLFNELLAVSSLVIVCIMSFLTLRRASRLENRIPSLDDYVEVNEDGTVDIEPRLAAIIGAIGQKMFQSAKMSLLQGFSVNAKLDKGLKGAIASDIVENKMPLINLIGDVLGVNTRQYIAKNPDALMQLISMPQVQGLLANFYPGGQGHNSPGNVPQM